MPLYNPETPLDISVADLPSTLTINNMSVAATAVYYGVEAAATGWPCEFGHGSTTALALTSTPVPTYGTAGYPGCTGPRDGSVTFNDGGHFASGSAIYDIGLNDFRFLIVCKVPSLGTASWLFGKLDATVTGYSCYIGTDGKLKFNTAIASAWGGSAETAVLTPGAWVVAELFWKRSTNQARWYVNGATSGSVVALSAGDVTDNAVFRIGAVYASGNATTAISYLAMHIRPSGWLDTHAQDSLALRNYQLLTTARDEVDTNENLTLRTLHLAPQKGIAWTREPETALVVDLGGTGTYLVNDAENPHGIIVQSDGGDGAARPAIEVRNTKGGHFFVTDFPSLGLTGPIAINGENILTSEGGSQLSSFFTVSGETTSMFMISSDVNGPCVVMRTLTGSDNDFMRLYMDDTVDVRTFTMSKEGTIRISPKPAATAQMVRLFGCSSTEGFASYILTETLSPAAVETSMTTAVPKGAIIRCVLANVQTALTGGSTTATWSLGITGDVDKYGTAGAPTQADSLAKNSKSSRVIVPVELSAAETIKLCAAAAGGAAAGDTALTVGTVKIVVVYDAPAALANA